MRKPAVLSIIVILAVMGVTMLAAPARAVTVITGCGGSYSGDVVLTNDITTNETWILNPNCIKLQGYQTLDCQGHTINGTGRMDGSPFFNVAIRISWNNVTIKNCVITNWNYGILNNQWSGEGSGRYWTVDNVTIINAARSGIAVGLDTYPTYFVPEHGTIKNSVIQNCASRGGVYDNGISLYGVNDVTIDNVHLNNNFRYAISIDANTSSDITIKNSVIEWNVGAFQISSMSTPADPLIYNNIISENVYLTTLGTPNIAFNIPVESGTNIMGGSELGGNFWTNPSSTGYSDTCPNADSDSFCDSPFILSSYQDNLPLAVFSTPPPTPFECSSPKDCSVYDTNTTAGLINSVICGIYNFFACIGSPLMMFVFMALGATIIASIFGLAYYILSRRA